MNRPSSSFDGMKWTIISGTNRPSSNSRKFSNYIESTLRKELGGSKDEEIGILDLTELPLEIFKPDAYANKPASFDSFRDSILTADAIISVLPEYNGSAPGAFKYFIDMLPFPESLHKVPCAFFGLSAGKFGALRSIEQMEQVFTYRNAFIYPESIYLMGVGENMDAQSGAPKDEFTLKLTHSSIKGFVDFARRLKK